MTFQKTRGKPERTKFKVTERFKEIAAIAFVQAAKDLGVDPEEMALLAASRGGELSGLFRAAKWAEDTLRVILEAHRVRIPDEVLDDVDFAIGQLRRGRAVLMPPHHPDFWKNEDEIFAAFARKKPRRKVSERTSRK